MFSVGTVSTTEKIPNCGITDRIDMELIDNQDPQ